MMSKERRRIIRAYCAETGMSEIDMRDVARWAISHGWRLPAPKSPIDVLAREFADAAREERRLDPNTGRAYRVYHSVETQHDRQLAFQWVDIHRASRNLMERSLTRRREQMIGDGVQLTFDAMFWNSINLNEPPIVLSMNFSADVARRVSNHRVDDDQC